MSRTILVRSCMIAVLVLVATACSGGARRSGDGEPGTVVIDNTNTSSDQVIVYLVSDSGNRQHLGTVTRGQERRFRISATPGRQYRLRAEMAAREELLSAPFTFAGGDVIEWDLQLNQVIQQR